MANQSVQTLTDAQKVSPLQLTRTQWQAGMTEQSHLANAFLTEPVVAETVAMIFGFKYKNPMQLLMNSIGGKEVIGNRQYQWRLMGDSEKAVPVSVAAFDGVANLGQYHTDFKVGFPEKHFDVKDYLRSDEGTILRVKYEPYQTGDHWIYTLELATSEATDYIAATEVALGSMFSKEYTALAEYDEGGYTTSSTPMELRNHMTTIAKSDSITRSAATDVMVLSLPDPDNPTKTTNLWTSYREWLFMQQWYREQERMAMYSRYNANAQGEVKVFSDNGRPVYVGAGIEEQIEMGETREYTKLSTEIVQEFLSNLSYNRKDMGDRKFVGFSGEFGIMEFHHAMKESFADWNISDASFTIEGKNMELKFGSQFKTFRGLNGTELTLMHFPLYDDTIMHRKLHPVTKKPLESYKMTVLDFGKVSGSTSNVVKMVKKDSEMLYWHVAGSISPTGPSKSLSTLRSNSRDGYSVHALTECGYKIYNPTSCGQLICNAQ